MNATVQVSAQKLQLDTIFDNKTLFSVIADQPWAMWLDSSDSEHVDSRYDIMVWQPCITLSTYGNSTTVSFLHNNTSYISQEDPLLLMKREQQTLFSKVDITSCHLPFKGGSVGYFAYDLGKRFEVIKSQSSKDIDIPEMAVGIYQQAIIYDKHSQCFWLLCSDDRRKKITDFFAKKLQKTISDIDNKIVLNNFKLNSTWRSNMPQTKYQENFTNVKNYLLSGDCYQINLAQRFTADYSGSEYQAYCALRQANKAPFSAFLRFADHAILSISPERFLQLNDNKVQSKPIKGTRPRSDDAIIDKQNANELKYASKDQAENLMIVDLLRNDISRVCRAGTVKVPAIFQIESFPSVHHLVSTVEGEILPEYDGSDLLRAAFPGGSITGAPKIRAMDIIEELEPNQRSVYCGSIGYLSACGKMDTSITIRTLVCYNKQIFCWAGGGLVADSDVDSEYQETYDKVNKILPVLTNLNSNNF